MGSPGRLKKRALFPAGVLALLLFLWLGTTVYSLSELRNRTVAPWAGWRLADQQLRLADFEAAGHPQPLVEEAAGEGRQELIVHWAAHFQKDADPRSRAAAAILWHLAGKEREADAVPLDDDDNPDRTELIRALLNGERADQGSLDY